MKLKPFLFHLFFNHWNFFFCCLSHQAKSTNQRQILRHSKHMPQHSRQLPMQSHTPRQVSLQHWQPQQLPLLLLLL